MESNWYNILMRKSHIFLALFFIVGLVGCSVSLPPGYTQKSCYEEYKESGLICVGYEEGIYKSYRGGIKIAYRADAGIINGFIKNESGSTKNIYIEFGTYSSWKSRLGMVNEYVSNLGPGERKDFNLLTEYASEGYDIYFIKLLEVRTD